MMTHRDRVKAAVKTFADIENRIEDTGTAIRDIQNMPELGVLTTPRGGMTARGGTFNDTRTPRRGDV